MNENLINRTIKLIEKDIVVTDEKKEWLMEGLSKIVTSKEKIDNLIQQTKISTIQNSLHLLVQRIMSEDKEGVIEMLNNNRDPELLFNFTEKMNQLLLEYRNYRKLYNEDYPELKKIKENLLLKEKDLLPLLTEVIKHIK